MFITVKFGDNRQELFNPHCRICNLLDNIRERCDCLKDDVIDLSDENGIRKNLFQTPTDYAIQHLEERDTLILVKIERFSGSMCDTCIPLLHGLQGDKDFLQNLNQNLNVDPNSQQDEPDRLKVMNPQGKRRGSINTRKQTPQNLLVGGKRNRSRSRSQSLAVGTGTTFLPKNIKK